MKDRRVSSVMVFFFALALVLVAAGLAVVSQSFSHFEELAMTQETYQELLDNVQSTALQTMVSGSMVVVGIGILVISVLHLLRSAARIQSEAESLKAKNEAMEALIEKTRNLAHHQRLETLGTLTSSIAHEFNNLLTPIMGYSLMALEKLQPEDELYDDILEIYQSSRQAKTIISRLSDLSRKNSADTFRQVSTDDLIRKTLDVAMPAKPKQLELVLNLNCWDQRITANEIQISQLLLNLILNAYQAVGENPGKLTISSSFDDKNVYIRVADTGCGIPKELQGKIFEPFFTTKESGRGTGLGLAIAAQVVEDHKGKISVHSRMGEGTEMTVSLPRNLKPIEKI